MAGVCGSVFGICGLDTTDGASSLTEGAVVVVSESLSSASSFISAPVEDWGCCCSLFWGCSKLMLLAHKLGKKILSC